MWGSPLSFAAESPALFWACVACLVLMAVGAVLMIVGAKAMRDDN